MVTMAENHAMNLSIIYHLTRVKAKIKICQDRFHEGFFTIQIVPMNVLSVPFSYILLLGRFQIP